MRLLSLQENGQLSLTDDILDHVPPYAILSHTWGTEDEELSFEDLRLALHDKNNANGHRKIQFCGKQAATDGLQYFWVDTCCINRNNTAELQEAITSMYKWYQNATRCYAYLTDVRFDSQDEGAWRASFRESRWLTRGWTLMELLAPRSVEFFDTNGYRLGDKTSLNDLLHETTNIPTAALNGQPLSTFSVSERMQWARRRDTERPEDKVYCLLGIFGVSISVEYGEGEEKAMGRLQRAISLSTTRDHKALCTLPMERNRAFIGRDSILRQLLQRISPNARPQDCQRIALEGLGGIGKTQIALEAAFRLQEREPNCSTFWVSAISRATFESDYRKIGLELGLPGIDNDKADVKALVVAALAKSSRNWLLIIDSLDDTDFLSETDRTISLFVNLPFSKKGSILFITRNHEVATNLGTSLTRVFTINKMSESEAMRMLSNTIKPKQMEDEVSTKTLLNLLAHLPLAIKQAAAYMTRTGKTTKEYLERYRLSDANRIELLSKNYEDLERHGGSVNALSQTWLVSFHHIKRRHPLAAYYLNLICFLAEKDIPRELIPHRNLHYTKIDEAIDALRGYWFIEQRDATDSFDIHPLVRLATRNSMDPRDAESNLQTIAKQLLLQYPYANADNQDICVRYTPHVEAVLGVEGITIDQELKAELLERVGRSYAHLVEDEMAMKMHQQAYELRKKIFSATHPNTLTSMHTLAISFTALGRYNQAEQLHRQVLKLRQERIGRRHADTLSSMDDLGSALQDRGKLPEAEKMHRDTLRLRQSVLGKKHIDTLHSMNNLALVLSAQEKYEEAEKQHREELELCEEVLGSKHPDTLCSMNNLGLVLRNLKQYDKAKDLIQECLALRREILGPKHPHTLNSLNNLALVLGDLDELEKAERMHREELQLSEETMGPRHPSVLISMGNLAHVLEKARKFEEATRLNERVTQLHEELRVEFGLPAEMGDHIRHGLEAVFPSLSQAVFPSTLPKEKPHGVGSSKPTTMSDRDTRPDPDSTRPTSVTQNISSASIADEKPIAENNIESFFSDMEDVQSQQSDGTTAADLYGKRLIGRFLAQDQQFRQLCTEALSKMDRSRFVDNVRRLLKTFQEDISAEAQTEPQKATARLLRSRRGRYRIGQEIFSQLKEEFEDVSQSEDTQSRSDPEEKQDIENWLEKLCDSGTQVGNPGAEYTAHSASSQPGMEEEISGLFDTESHGDSDSDSSDGSHNEQFPIISGLEKSFRASKAYTILLENFTMLFVPLKIRRVFLSTPRNKIWLSKEQDSSAMNWAKLWLEERTRCRWNWWPLAPPKHMLHSNEVRIMWQCNCGEMLWDTISVEHSRWVEKLRSFPNRTEILSFCPVEEKPPGSLLMSALGEGSIVGGGGADTGAPAEPQVDHDTQAASIGSTVPSTTSASTDTTTDKNSTPGTSINTDFDLEQGIQAIKPKKPSHWVLFGVQRRKPARKPAEIPIDSFTRDRDFFQELKSVYAKHRGPLRLWFSMWQLDSCEFVKFQRISENIMVREYPDLPPRGGIPPKPGDYYYKHQNGRDLTKSQPVSRHAFQIFLKGCDDSCNLIWPHTCMKLNDKRVNLDCIPKRNLSFEKDGDLSEVWGLGTIHVLSFVHVFGYHLVMIAGTMGFFAWWMAASSGDLQNAAVPISLGIGVVSLFWNSGVFRNREVHHPGT